MSALLNDATMLHDHDDVGVAHGAQAVSDDKGGAPLHERVHALLYESLSARVDVARRLVEDERGRVGYRSPSNSDELSLTLRQVSTIAREHGVVALRQTRDKVVGMHSL